MNADVGAHLDTLFGSNPAIAMALAVSVEARVVVAEWARGESSAAGARPSAVPSPEFVREYAELAVACGGPFSKDLDPPRARDEWTVMRFETAQWSVAAYREGGQADSPRRQWVMVVFVDNSIAE